MSQQESAQNITVASFDPASTRNLGWAVVDTEMEEGKCVSFNGAAGTFVMPKVNEVWQSLWPMFVCVDEMLEHYQPDIIIVEKTSPFAGGFITGQVSNCMGVILASCSKREMPVVFVYPTHVKKMVTGAGRATKTKVKNAVRDIFKSYGVENIKFDSEHAYDATANILCWLFDTDRMPNPLTSTDTETEDKE